MEEQNNPKGLIEQNYKNPVFRKAYHRNYYKENKERMLSQLKEKEQCPTCFKMVTRGNMCKHIKTTYHIQASKGLTRWNTPFIPKCKC